MPTATRWPGRYRQPARCRIGTLYRDTDGPSGIAPVALAEGQTISIADINAGFITFVPVTNVEWRRRGTV